MKKCLHIVGLLFVLQTISIAQPNFRFADSTAQWNVLETQWCMTAPCVYFQTGVYRVDGDTVIGSLQYQKIKNYNTVCDFIRKDSTGKVYRKDSIGEYLIYNFSATVNDTFHISINQWAGSAFVKVLSVDTVVWDKPRKRMELCINFWAPDCTFMNFTAVEGIGVINSHFLYPAIDVSYTDGPSYRLLCYTENGMTVYQDTVMNTCVLDSSWNSLVHLQSSIFIISPNPATTQITIQSESNFQSSSAFQLFDITGQMVLQQTLTDKTNQISVSTFSKGMYLYRLVSPGHQPVSGKLAIE